ncbi:MAG: DUF924 family protein, partial [Pseudomonadota bacterium]
AEQSSIEAILHFWFGETTGDWCVEDRNHLWWYEDSEVDQNIIEHFGELHVLASEERLAHWVEEPRGRLALIILLDQFTRNIYRKTAMAFSGDALSLRLCLEGREKGHDMALKLIERVFFYMPLMHAESRELQEVSLRCYTAIHEQTATSDRDKSERYVGAARLHSDIIKQFGRYPHRNALLERANTPEEDAYLAGDYEDFGQS